MKRFFSLLCVSLLIFLLTGCSAEQELNYDQAIEKLNAFTESGITGKAVSHKADTSWVGGDSSINELPPIDKYPLSVKGSEQINIEIFSSTEKSSASTDNWMEIQAKEFNSKKIQVGGKTVSVSIRPIASGLALDYITKRAHIPDAYSPANELWGEMINSVNIPIELVEKRLTGNTAGILMKKSAYDIYTKKYGKVNVENVVKAVLAGDIVLGHTNPNVSSTGLNIFTQELRSFDPKNPFSAESLEKFRQFQNAVPPTSPTTKEMSKVAVKGIMDSMIMEAQAYSVEPTLSDWVFTPCGIRHDSPVYALDNLSVEKKEALKLFVKFCKTTEAQESATSFGFNLHNDYSGEINKYTGSELFSALKIWKENKDGGKPVISVFIVDRSGSMTGNKLKRVKDALKNSLQYINGDGYVGLISYSSSDDVSIDLPISKFTPKQQSLFAGAVNDFEAGGGTATNNALVVALDQILKIKASVPNAKMRILVLSDGEQLNGLSLSEVTGLVNGIGIPIYGVGFEADLSDLQELADINEGYCINADSQDVVYKLRDLFVAEL
jgi:Ca-activated chloride channel family protein